VRVGVDATPLVAAPRRGVARALSHLLRGWPESAREGLVLFAPVSLRDSALRALPWAVCRTPAHPPGSMKVFRRDLRALVARDPVDVFLSPWSAFPRLSVPVVVTVHEIPFVRWGPIEGRLRAWAHRRWLARDVREAAAIVVPSEATRADLLRLHPDAAPRTAVVPHGFDPEPWERAGRERTEPARPFGLLVGASSRRKGVDVFLRARTALRDLGLRWVLAGPAARFAVRALARAGSPEDVESVTPGDDELRRLVASARLLVFPSRSEGFGFPPLEAMAAGVPVVATRVGSVPEVVGDAAHLVEPGDSGALAAGVRAVATDGALRERLVAAGRLRARAFPCGEAARRTLAVLDRAASLTYS
jgi:glycosyltransferase involved in cell wall biosynthesis